MKDKEKKNEIKEEVSNIIENTLQNIKSIADGNTIIGKPIKVNESITIIPLNKINVGYVIGESNISLNKKSSPSLINGSTTGFNVFPLGYILSNKNLVQYVNLDKAYPYKKLVDLVEQTVKILSSKQEKNKKWIKR